MLEEEPSHVLYLYTWLKWNNSHSLDESCELQLYRKKWLLASMSDFCLLQQETQSRNWLVRNWFRAREDSSLSFERCMCFKLIIWGKGFLETHTIFLLTALFNQNFSNTGKMNKRTDKRTRQTNNRMNKRLTRQRINKEMGMRNKEQTNEKNLKWTNAWKRLRTNECERTNEIMDKRIKSWTSKERGKGERKKYACQVFHTFLSISLKS